MNSANTASGAETAQPLHPPFGQSRQAERLPLAKLLALALATFITVLTEALPAGILPMMSNDLDVSEALIGQLVTVYAIGTLATAIPLTAATQGWRRRPLLLVAIGGFAVVNLVTAFSTSYALTLGARFVAGIFAGLLWALVAGYAVRMVPDHRRGRAMTIAMAGIPLALSIGIPAFTFVASLTGWRIVFGIMSVLTVILFAWTAMRMPDFPGQPGERHLSLASVVNIPGIRAVLAVTLTFVLAHNILYTYIAPYLVPSGLGDRVDLILLAFGVIALVSIWIVGMLIDRWLRELVLVSLALFAIAAFAMGVQGANAAAIIVAVAVWGLAWGGAPTLLQTASAKAAGEAADVAQSMIVTVWNIAMASGGIIGGLLLENAGAGTFPWVVLALLALSAMIAFSARQRGFPAVDK